VHAVNDKNLYQLLGALADDDAEELRAAFRRAVKATHPDSNTDDPDAPLRFRRIVRANAILSDPEQRAGYDRLMALAIRQQDSKPQRTFIATTIRRLAADTMAVAVLAVMLVGGYLAFGYFSRAPGDPMTVTVVTAHGPAGIEAATPAEPLETTGRGGPRNTLEVAEVPDEAIATSAAAPAASADGSEVVAKVGPVETVPVTPAAPSEPTGRHEPHDVREAAGVSGETMESRAVAAEAATVGTGTSADAGPAPDLTVNDAKSHRERGIAAYLDGDLSGALAEFDVAIQLDPDLAGAYVDRSVVFYRRQEFARAFADIAQAKRIASSNRTGNSAPVAHRASVSPPDQSAPR
jgi:tetratricopeptide (TPR) repeat protein